MYCIAKCSHTANAGERWIAGIEGDGIEACSRTACARHQDKLQDAACPYVIMIYRRTDFAFEKIDIAKVIATLLTESNTIAIDAPTLFHFDFFIRRDSADSRRASKLWFRIRPSFIHSFGQWQRKFHIDIIIISTTISNRTWYNSKFKNFKRKIKFALWKLYKKNVCVRVSKNMHSQTQSSGRLCEVASCVMHPGCLSCIARVPQSSSTVCPQLLCSNERKNLIKPPNERKKC